MLDDRVIASAKYATPKNDFRTNTGKVKVIPHQFSEHVETMAVKATKSLGLTFGGVDAIIDEQGEAYITEVNMPCFFPRCQFACSAPIAQQMIEYLMEQARLIEALEQLHQSLECEILILKDTDGANFYGDFFRRIPERLGIKVTVVEKEKSLTQTQIWSLTIYPAQAISLSTQTQAIGHKKQSGKQSNVNARCVLLRLAQSNTITSCLSSALP